MMNDAGKMLFVLAIGFTGAVYASLSEDDIDPPAKPVVLQHESRRDDQRDLMDALLEEVDRENLLRAVEHVESHGNPKAVSPKGAKGRWQLMDKTAKKPGLGVEPLRDHSQKEQKRFARDYLNALIKHYHGDRRLALAAYNGGVGLVDRVLAQMPRETQEYVVKVQQFADSGE